MLEEDDEARRVCRSEMSSSHRVVRPEEGRPETITRAMVDMMGRNKRKYRIQFFSRSATRKFLTGAIQTEQGMSRPAMAMNCETVKHPAIHPGGQAIKCTTIQPCLLEWPGGFCRKRDELLSTE